MEESNQDLSLNVDDDVDIQTPTTDSDRDIHPPTTGFDEDLVTESDGARARTPQFNSTTDIDNTSDTADLESDAMRHMAAGFSGSQESRQRNTKTSTVRNACWETRYQSYFCDENQEIREDNIRRRFASAGLSYYRRGGQAKCFRCGVIFTHHSGHDPVITHAHLSPDCEFMRLEFGQSFMDFVTELSQTENVSELTESDVYRKMKAGGIPVDRRNEDCLTGMSIEEAQRLGFTLTQINRALRTLRERSVAVSFENLIQELRRSGQANIRPISVSQVQQSDVSLHLAESDNGHQTGTRRWSDLRDRLTCVFCCFRAVEVFILPCGHVILCIECSMALEECPICQSVIRWRGRVYLCL